MKINSNENPFNFVFSLSRLCDARGFARIRRASRCRNEKRVTKSNSKCTRYRCESMRGAAAACITKNSISIAIQFVYIMYGSFIKGKNRRNKRILKWILASHVFISTDVHAMRRYRRERKRIEYIQSNIVVSHRIVWNRFRARVRRIWRSMAHTFGWARKSVRSRTKHISVANNNIWWANDDRL